jgi:hypothetical protein
MMAFQQFELMQPEEHYVNLLTIELVDFCIHRFFSEFMFFVSRIHFGTVSCLGVLPQKDLLFFGLPPLFGVVGPVFKQKFRQQYGNIRC